MTIHSIIVAGGGTGGHLFPGIAVVEELRRRSPDVDVTFVGTERGIEARVIPERGERLELIEVTPLKGRTAAELLRSLMRLPGAFGRANQILSRHKPDLVIGVGGYASGPMLLAAAARGIPTAVLEQNAHVGLTNRVLAPIAGRAYVAFEEAADQIGRKARLLGNPVRRAFVDAARAASADPDGFEARARHVFVLGGSQGAKALNERVPEALAELGLSERGIRVVHQTGAKMRDAVAARYEELGVDAEVTPFVEDMARAYSASALVIARAGATTLAELCALGRPSILVPYPHAADDHQARNAEALERAGAAVCIRESSLDVARLTDAARALLDDVGARRAMAEAARRHGHPDAAAAIVDDLFTWLGAPAHSSTHEPSSGESDDDGAARFRSVDFGAGRGLRARRLRDTAPPPPAYLQVLVSASTVADTPR